MVKHPLRRMVSMPVPLKLGTSSKSGGNTAAAFVEDAEHTKQESADLRALVKEEIDANLKDWIQTAIDTSIASQMSGIDVKFAVLVQQKLDSALEKLHGTSEGRDPSSPSSCSQKIESREDLLHEHDSRKLDSILEETTDLPKDVSRGGGARMPRRGGLRKRTSVFQALNSIFWGSDKETDTGFKLIYAFAVTVFYVSAAYFGGRYTLNFGLAAALVLVLFPFLFLFWIKVLNAPGIYHVRVPTVILPDWIQVSLPSPYHKVELKKHLRVDSISALSGIRGAHMMVALRIVSAAMGVIMIVSIHCDLHHRGRQFLDIESREDMVPVFLLIQLIGLFYTGHFELNQVDQTHERGHYTGVGLIMIGSLHLGFVTSWSLLSFSLIGLQYTLCIIWCVACGILENESDDKNVVTRNSKICIGIELLMFQVVAVAGAITIYAMGANEGNIYSSPFINLVEPTCK